MKHATWLLCAALLLPLLADDAELKLKPLHPDETVEQTLNKRFSLENALAVIGTIQDWLGSFRRLTAAAKGKIAAAAWKKIGNTERDIQALGFANQPRAVEGALRYQHWQLKQALYRLALMKAQAGKTPAQQTEQARRELQQAESEFREFWDSMSIAD
jgi:hypothetical protein